MLRQIIKELLGKSSEARRNRVWVVFIDENGPLLLSPAYFKQYHHEEDQLHERKPTDALSRLGRCLGLQQGLRLSYLERFAIKGGSTYKDLHVFYVVVPVNEKIPSILRDYLCKLRMDVPQQRDVAESLDTTLASDQLYTIRRLQFEGMITP